MVPSSPSLLFVYKEYQDPSSISSMVVYGKDHSREKNWTSSDRRELYKCNVSLCLIISLSYKIREREDPMIRVIPELEVLEYIRINVEFQGRRILVE